MGGLTAITRDVPPYMVVDGPEGKVRAVNTRGLARRGFNDSQIACLKTAYRLLFKDTTPMVTQAVELERLHPDNAEIKTLLAFMRESTNGKFGRRGKIHGGRRNGSKRMKRRRMCRGIEAEAGRNKK